MNDLELDALVAEHVFGWTICRDGDGQLAGIDAPRGFPPDVESKCIGRLVPSYSTDGNHMLAVIEKMRERDWLASVTLRICGERVEDERMQFEAEFRQWRDWWAYDPSAPRAVAIAALKVLGVEVSP